MAQERQEIHIPQSVVDAVLAFANGFSYEDKRRLATERPGELLGEHADAMLEVLIAQYQNEPDAAESLLADRELLADCRELGVDEAFARRLRPTRSELDQGVLNRMSGLTEEEDIIRFLARRPGIRRLLLEAVQALVAAQGADGKEAVLAREADLLLTPAAEYLFRTGRDENFVAHADLVAVAREYGVGPALDWAGWETEIETLEGTPEEHEIAFLLQELAYADRRMTPGRKAELCRRGRELAAPGSPEWAGFTTLLGEALTNMHGPDRADRLEEAIECHRAVAEYGLRTGRPVVVAQSHSKLAHAYIERARGDRDENLRRAHAHATEALALASESGIDQADVPIQQVLVRVAMRGGPDDDGDGGLRRILAVRDRLNPLEDPDHWAAIQMCVAEVLMSGAGPDAPDKAEQAIEALRSGLAYVDPGGRPESWARIQAQLADTYLRRVAGDHAENVELAIDHARAALTLFTRDRYPDQWADAQERLADGIRLRCSCDPAADALDTAQAGDAAQAGEAGDAAEANAGEAARLYEEVAAYYEETGESGRWAGVRLKLGYLRRSAADAPSHAEWAARLTLADMAARQGDLEGALAGYVAAAEELEAAFAFAEQPGEAGWQETPPVLNHAYTHAAYVSLLAGRPEEALRLSDLSTARALDLAVVQPDQAAVQPDLAVVQPDQAVAQADLAVAQPAQADLGVVHRGLGASDTATTVVPVITGFGSALIIVPPEGGAVQVARLDGLTLGEVRRQEAAWLQSYLDWQLGGPPAGLMRAMDGVAAWLWEAVGEPLRRRLDELGVVHGSRLRVAASSLSGFLPLHAARPSAGGPALLDDYVISYTPNLRVAGELRRRAEDVGRAPGSILVLADSLGDLPYAAQEAAAVAGLFPADRRMVLTGPEVTAEAVEAYAPSCGLLHIACHASVTRPGGGQPAIWTADRDPLVASRVAAFDLSSVRLVVLSACGSGITTVTGGAGSVGGAGDSGSGESGGYAGLVSAFLRAGAAGVVASMWSVSDQATAFLMRRFYAEFLAGAAPAEALRAAQLWLRGATIAELVEEDPAAARRWRLLGHSSGTRPYANPFFWAGFSLMGE
ncbi:CHAT domain-containing protein [Streptosporangiaceae bacterium NEAU-GS5]|nr:CHAT domain-containing protein [Streptosporangiaceae bacterium NEAU-GS5]